MAEITAAMVMELREKSGAGMMDCKKALLEADGNLQNAVDILRKLGIAKAEKKSSRMVKEGIIVSYISGNLGVLAEVLCETDFVASNEKFRDYAKGLAERAAAVSGEGDISAQIQEQEKNRLVDLIAVIGENMQIRRAVRWKSKGSCASYLHMGGRIGVLVDVEGNADKTFLNDLCMHIAAFKPQFVSPESVPAEVIEKEKEIASAQIPGNKPPEILGKIVMGKVEKWFTQVCLTKQPWLRDDKRPVEKVNPEAKIKRFIRWEVGEEL